MEHLKLSCVLESTVEVLRLWGLSRDALCFYEAMYFSNETLSQLLGCLGQVV